MSKTQLLSIVVIAAAFMGVGCKPSAQEQLAQQVLDAQAKVEAMPNLDKLVNGFAEFVEADAAKRPGRRLTLPLLFFYDGNNVKEDASGFTAVLTSDPINMQDGTTYTYTATYHAKDKHSEWVRQSASVKIQNARGEWVEQL